MLKLAGWVVGVVLFVWATVSAFSIISELKFLVDGWTWSVGQVPISIKVIALTIGEYVSGVVGGYREFVLGLVVMLHLPHLPQVVYDTGVVAAFSTACGNWLYRRAKRKFIEAEVRLEARRLSEEDTDSVYEAYVEEGERLRKRFLLLALSANVAIRLYLWFTSDDSFSKLRRVENFVFFCAGIIIHGCVVAIVIATLFNIDFIYRHFA